MKILVPLLALVMLLAVGFVLVELHAPITPPADSGPTPPPAPPVAAPRPTIVTPPPTPSPLPSTPSPAVAPPSTTPLPVGPPPPITATSPPQAPAVDPLDVVVGGRTRRVWHAYYADRQQKITADIQRYQSVVDRAIAGEEPDPKELGDAHDKIRELNKQLKEDLESLSRIDGPQ